MNIQKHLRLWLALGALVCASPARADDTAGMQDEIADLRAKVAAMESSLMAPAAGGDSESLRGMRGKSAIMIGGDFNVDLIYKHRDDYTGAGRDDDDVDSTEFTTNSANLRLKVNASADTYLYMKLDLDDFARDHDPDNPALQVDQDDLLEECKFVFDHVAGSSLGFVFGKGEVPYGQDKTLGILQSYNHNDETYSSEGPGFLLARTEGYDPLDPANAHANVGYVRHPGEVDNVFLAQVNYDFQDLLRFELALFQNGGGMHEDRSNDSLFFQSMAARMWLMPFEGMTMQLSLIRMYCDSMRDRGVRTDLADPSQGTDAQYALSFGFDYKLSALPLEIFGEYQHGWDWAYTKGYDTNTYQLGLIYALRQNLDLGLMGEWLDINNDHANLAGVDSSVEDDYYRMVLSAKYTMGNGIYFILEYAHEWFDRGANNGGDDYDREADMLAFRTGWAF